MSRSTTRQGPAGRRVAMKSRMRWVAMGSSGEPRMVDEERTRPFSRAAGGDPARESGSRNATDSDADDARPSAIGQVTAMAWRAGPAALQARKVCLFRIPGYGDRERPERPAPSLLQGVHDSASSGTDRRDSRSLQVPSRQPSHSRTGGRPQARATLGKRGYRERACHTQQEISRLRPSLAKSVSFPQAGRAGSPLSRISPRPWTR